jgi:hypothetical protein
LPRVVLTWRVERERGGGGETDPCPDTHYTSKLLKQWVLICEEAIFLVHTSPWETEFTNTAFGIYEMPEQERAPKAGGKL